MEHTHIVIALTWYILNNTLLATLVKGDPKVTFSIIFTNPFARTGYDTRSIFKRSLTGFNSEFSFSWTSCLTKAEVPNLSYYLPIAGGRIIGFIPFPRVLVLCEMQSASSRFWTRIVVSNSYDDNHYTTVTFSIATTPRCRGIHSLDYSTLPLILTL